MGKVAQKRALHLYLKNLVKVDNRQLGETSSNLVTLVMQGAGGEAFICTTSIAKG
jgi:hypothetical protein